MKSILLTLRHIATGTLARLHTWWRRYRSLRKPYQVLVAAVIIGLLLWGITIARSTAPTAATFDGRTVTLATVSELSGNGGMVDFVGTVRSVTEANILAQTGGVVQAVHTRVGSRVSAGAIIVELENAAERAAVLSAEGSYEAAVAAQQAVSPEDAKAAAINAYTSAYNTIDSALQTQADLFFGDATPYGPRFLLFAPMYDYGELSEERRDLSDKMKEYQRMLPNASSGNPTALLAEAKAIAQEVSAFLNKLATAANKQDSNATATQLAALTSARSTISTLIATLSSAQESYRSDSVTTTASTDASVKQALGGLRSAQAALAQTMVRAPISGQINFLPIRVGEYVSALQHVATVAQNGSLEVVAYVSEDNRDLLVAGGAVVVAGEYSGVVTSIAPALDPVTKQIEVRIAVTATEGLVNGQAVTISLPDTAPRDTAEEGPVLLPLAAVKLRAGDRIIFSVGDDGRLISHAVEVGEVHGDRIEILTPLDMTMSIVSDARGLSEGEAVKIAPTTTTSAL